MYYYIYRFARMIYFDIKKILKNLFYILFIFFIIFFILNLFIYNKSFAAYSENASYTDGISSIQSVYENYCNDFVRRCSSTSKNSRYYSLISYLNNSNYAYYITYTSKNGTRSLNGSPLDTTVLYINFYARNSTFTINADYTNFNSLPCNVYKVVDLNNTITFEFNGNTLLSSSGTGTLYIPFDLLNYNSSAINSLLSSTYDSSSSDITTSINNQTNTIKEESQKIDNSINQTNDFLKDENVDDNSMSVNTDSTVEDNQDVSNFFNSLIANFTNKITNMRDDYVETIFIPLPKRFWHFSS